MKPIDLTGKRFGRWTVLRRAPDRGDYVVRWVCKCGCEDEREIPSASLRNGFSIQCKSCAQQSRRSMIEARAERKIWHGIKQRCYNPENPKYAAYGGRGIRVCERWMDFKLFFADMGFRPSKRHTLNRINNDGNYCPENVAWALPTEQANNRRSSRLLELNGERLTLAQWARKYDTDMQRTWARLARGWSLLRALTEPAGKPGGNTRLRRT